MKSCVSFAMSWSVSLPDLAEVDEADARVREDEDVRRVRVAVEEAVPEDHLHPGLGHPVGELPARLERLRVEVEVGELAPSRNSSVRIRLPEYVQ